MPSSLLKQYYPCPSPTRGCIIGWVTNSGGYNGYLQASLYENFVQGSRDSVPHEIHDHVFWTNVRTHNVVVFDNKWQHWRDGILYLQRMKPPTHLIFGIIARVSTRTFFFQPCTLFHSAMLFNFDPPLTFAPPIPDPPVSSQNSNSHTRPYSAFFRCADTPAVTSTLGATPRLHGDLATSTHRPYMPSIPGRLPQQVAYNNGSLPPLKTSTSAQDPVRSRTALGLSVQQYFLFII